MSSPTILNGGVQIFKDLSQYECFNTTFRGIVGSPKHCEECTSLGMMPNNCSTHSIQKVAATHVLTGSMTSPSIVSICLRANGAMPSVLSWYIKYEHARNQCVSQRVGWVQLSTVFALYHYHYHYRYYRHYYYYCQRQCILPRPTR